MKLKILWIKLLPARERNIYNRHFCSAADIAYYYKNVERYLKKCVCVQRFAFVSQFLVLRN